MIAEKNVSFERVWQMGLQYYGFWIYTIITLAEYLIVKSHVF